MNQTNITVVIVSYKSASLSNSALKTVLAEKNAHPHLNIKVVVVDNDSGDFDEINTHISEQAWGDWVTVLAAPKNGGYGYGNNYGFKYALDHWDVDYFHLLNPDTQLRANAIVSLVDFLDKNPVVGIAGSSFETQDGEPWPYAFRFPSLLSEVEAYASLGFVSKLLKSKAVAMTMSQVSQPVDWVSGASMMMRKTLVQTTKGFDESYFLYYEETDLSQRAKALGHISCYVPESRVMHILGQSTGVTEITEKPKRLPQYWFESRINYFIAHHGLLKAALIDFATIATVAFANVKRFIKRTVFKQQDYGTPYFIQDLLAHSPLLGKTTVAKAFRSTLLASDNSEGE